MKNLTLSLIALAMSGCLVLCLFGPHQAEATISRCQVVNTIMDLNDPAWDSNCIFKIRDILNTTAVGEEQDSGFRYEQMQINGSNYCLEPTLFQVPCDKKCEDIHPDQIDLVNITCSKPTVRSMPPPFGDK